MVLKRPRALICLFSEDSTRFLSLTDLTSSPQLVSNMSGLYTFQQVNNKTTTQAHSQIDTNLSILDKLVQCVRRENHKIPLDLGITIGCTILSTKADFINTQTLIDILRMGY